MIAIGFGQSGAECIDHLIVFSAEYLRRILAKYAAYYNELRTHVTLGKDAPCTRTMERFGDIVAIRFLAGSTIDKLESSFQKRQALPSRPR